MSKPAIFKNEELQKSFDENGFVKMRMFNEAQIKRLHDFYVQTQTKHETVIDRKKFHATNDTDDAQLIGEADRFIKEVMFEEIDKHFYNYKTIAANYLLKQPSEQSDLAPHQDLRFVDEENYYSFNIWVATEPTNKLNGCLRFLKGSHKIVDTIRPLPSYPWKFNDIIGLIPPYMTDVTTEVGECVILNHACIHASYPNLSGRTRIAAILAMIPKEAEIYHYFLPDGNPENEVEKYAMTLDDFINLKVGHRPETAILLEKSHCDFSPVTAQQFTSWANQHIGKPKEESNSLYGYISNKISSLYKGFR